MDVNVLDVALAELGPIAGLVYLRFYRLSYGWRQNTRRVNTRLWQLAMSDRTVQSAVNKLIMEGYIEQKWTLARTPAATSIAFTATRGPYLGSEVCEGASPEESSGEGTTRRSFW